jgi:hypothetical protein
MAVFWVVAPCSLVEVYQRFRGPCCLHHQGDRHLRTHRCENLKSYFITKTVYVVMDSPCLTVTSLNGCIALRLKYNGRFETSLPVGQLGFLRLFRDQLNLKVSHLNTRGFRDIIDTEMP